MNERIKAVRKYFKMTQAEFGSRIGVKANTITNYETGTRAPGEAVIISICREFRVNRVWLETGVGEMFELPSYDEDAAAFFADALRCEGLIKSKLVHVLARLSPKEWEALESIARKMIEEDQGGKE